MAAGFGVSDHDVVARSEVHSACLCCSDFMHYFFFSLLTYFLFFYFDFFIHGQVTCVVIPREHAQLLSPASSWRHEPGDLALVERLLQLKVIKVSFLPFSSTSPEFLMFQYSAVKE